MALKVGSALRIPPVVGHRTVGQLRNVEIDAHQHLPAGHVKVSHGLLGHGISLRVDRPAKHELARSADPGPWYQKRLAPRPLTQTEANFVISSAVRFE